MAPATTRAAPPMRLAASRRPIASPRRKEPQPDTRRTADSRSGATTDSGARKYATSTRTYVPMARSPAPVDLAHDGLAPETSRPPRSRMNTASPAAVTGNSTAANNHGATSLAPTRSTVEYVAIETPHASAHGMAASTSGPPRRYRQ